jgi:hypothetical protein
VVAVRWGGLSALDDVAWDYLATLSNALRSCAVLSNPLLVAALWTSPVVRGIVDIGSSEPRQVLLYPAKHS